MNTDVIYAWIPKSSLRGAKRRGNLEKIIKKFYKPEFFLPCFVKLLCNSSRNDRKNRSMQQHLKYKIMTNIKHLAIIMDGNARWADRHNLTTSEGHKLGADKIRELLPEFINLNIPYITLYTFSSENWQRSSTEVDFLIKLLSIYLKNELNSLHKNGVKIKVIGRLNLLSSSLQKQINNAIELTKNNNKITLCIAFSYGSRQEIVDACTKIIASGKKEISESDIGHALYDPEMPDVDLLIRPGGVYRISNFLLWQAAYAELYFSPKYWPDFNKDDIIETINDYSKRKRTFGKR